MEQNRIPFDIALRPEIEAGKYKVVTRDWLPVRILCWNAKLDCSGTTFPIVALLSQPDGSDRIATYLAVGLFFRHGVSPDDLFLVPVEGHPDNLPGTDRDGGVNGEKGVSGDKITADLKNAVRWRKGDNTLQEGGLYLIRTREGSTDDGFIYYVEWRESLSDYEEYIPIEKLEKLPKEDEE